MANTESGVVKPTLYIFGGLPGTGKSTLAAALARRTKAAYLRIDTIEQSLRDAGVSAEGPAGYLVGYALARDNLHSGRNVVADSVNPLGVTRAAWRDVARQTNRAFVEIEVVCSDVNEHRTRVETRPSTVPGLVLPTWEAVQGRDYEPWDTPHLVLDTAGQSPGRSIAALLAALETESRANDGEK